MKPNSQTVLASGWRALQRHESKATETILENTNQRTVGVCGRALRRGKVLLVALCLNGTALHMTLDFNDSFSVDSNTCVNRFLFNFVKSLIFQINKK